MRISDWSSDLCSSDLSDPFFWGVISTILAFIPVVGAPLIFVPASIIAISQGDTYNGIGMLLFGLLIITNIDNILRLVIAKRIGNIHPKIGRASCRERV